VSPVIHVFSMPARRYPAINGVRERQRETTRRGEAGVGPAPRRVLEPVAGQPDLDPEHPVEALADEERPGHARAGEPVLVQVAADVGGAADPERHEAAGVGASDGGPADEDRPQGGDGEDGRGLHTRA
jgi:hypothetical protein